MKKSLFCIISFLLLYSIISTLAYFYQYSKDIPNQTTYWYDSSIGIFRVCPKGLFNKSKKGTTWFSEKDIEKIELKMNYERFSETMKQMQMAEEYKQYNKGQ